MVIIMVVIPAMMAVVAMVAAVISTVFVMAAIIASISHAKAGVCCKSHDGHWHNQFQH